MAAGVLATRAMAALRSDRYQTLVSTCVLAISNPACHRFITLKERSQIGLTHPDGRSIYIGDPAEDLSGLQPALYGCRGRRPRTSVAQPPRARPGRATQLRLDYGCTTVVVVAATAHQRRSEGGRSSPGRRSERCCFRPFSHRERLQSGELWWLLRWVW